MVYTFFFFSLVLLLAAILFFRKQSEKKRLLDIDVSLDSFIEMVMDKGKYSDDAITKLMPRIKMNSIQEVQKVHDAIIQYRHHLLGTFQALDSNPIF